MDRMMTIDVTYCGELVVQAGDEIYRQMARTEEWPQEREGLFQRFKEIDLFMTSTLRDGLMKRYPGIPWSEAEFDVTRQKSPEFEGTYWVCDTLDGAVHYLHDLPSWSISLCLVHGGKPSAAFIYDPVKRELFHAEAGRGAYLNGKPIHVSAKRQLADSVIATSPPSYPAEEPVLTQAAVQGLSRVFPKAFAVRMLGAVSLQLAYVACGRLDGFWEYSFDLYEWLAGALLIQEAGGRVTSSGGEAFDWGSTGIVAANPYIQPQLQLLVQEDAA
ncbi:inositol monophosphatase family protein [Paenibacillus rigui]|nr:inositol monophosphatase family protein [Paenibacillus rigui]